MLVLISKAQGVSVTQESLSPITCHKVTRVTQQSPWVPCSVPRTFDLTALTLNLYFLTLQNPKSSC